MGFNYSFHKLIYFHWCVFIFMAIISFTSVGQGVRERFSGLDKTKVKFHA
jgi:hypothetical protein